MKRILIFIFLMSICLLAIFCLRGNNTETEDFSLEYRKGLGEIGVKGLQSYLDRFELSDDAVQRVQQALRQWENNKCDSVPILISVRIVKSHEDMCRMGIYFSDEDTDVVGFGIREEHLNENGEKVVVEESYPIFYHFSPPTVWLSVFEFEERVSGKGKDEKSWQDFVENLPTEILPSIVTSIPDPNNIEVWVWLYDRAGNQSEPIKAVNEIE